MKSLDFFKHTDAPELFAKLDYALKDGVHIQKTPSQAVFFEFIVENEDSLNDYYQQFYGVFLEHGGESINKYYYLDFGAKSRGNVPEQHRYFLPNEFVIAGFLIYKIIYIDNYVDLSSVVKLQKIIRQEYTDLKPGLYRTLAKAKRVTHPTKLNDKTLDKIIHDALKEFSKIGWVLLENDFFDMLPAFQRILKIYGDYINDLENWLKEEH